MPGKGESFNARQVARQETLALSVEGVSQMVFIYLRGS